MLAPGVDINKYFPEHQEHVEVEANPVGGLGLLYLFRELAQRLISLAVAASGGHELIKWFLILLN